MKLKALVLYVQLVFSTHMRIVREYKCFYSKKSNNETTSVCLVSSELREILFSEEERGSSAPSVSS